MKLVRRLFVPDTHAPFHDPKPFKLMLEVAKDFKPDEVVILGDFFDAYSVSFHTKNPERVFLTIEDEFDRARSALHDLVAAVPKARLVFLSGNHEDRVNNYLRAYAPVLAKSINLEQMLKLPRGTTFYPYGQKNRHFMGKLLATHGTIYSQHVALGMLRKYGMSVIFGHTHRLQEFNIKTVHGDRLKGITIGWLGEVEHAGEYVKDVADWVHAFAVSYHYAGSGDFVIQPIEVQNGRAVFDGRIY